MINLFSIFKPSSSVFNLSTNWISTFLGILFIPYLYWASPSRWSLFWSKILSTLHMEFKALLLTSHMGSSILFVSLFTLIVFDNFLGLAPYVFTSSSHMVMTFSLSFPLGVALMLFGWIQHSNYMFAHLLPQGTPFALMPFMVFGSTFIVATGFHGLHAIIGTSFLSVCFYCLYECHFSSKHHLAFEAAAWYWHFVDVVRLFLYMLFILLFGLYHEWSQGALDWS